MLQQEQTEEPAVESKEETEVKEDIPEQVEMVCMNGVRFTVNAERPSILYNDN